MQKRVCAIVLLVLLLSIPAVPVRSAPRCFPEAAPVIADCVDGRIASFWQQNGGLPVFGYPIGPQRVEPVAGGSVAAQPFERNRLELHPEHAAPYDVQLGRLGAELLDRQGRDWQSFPKADPGAPHFFAETSHAIAPAFWPYWSGHGLEFDRRPGTAFAESLALFGLPLSEAQVETSLTDGKPYLTQWFERARFELHPENAGTPHLVLLGLLGRELQDAPAPAAPATNLAPGGFVQVAGAQLTRLGEPVILKGVNYYPQWRPWSEMWRRWDGPQIERELRPARDAFGINSLRVLLPYNFSGRRDDAGKVTPLLVERLRELLQIAAGLDMRVLVTLFDFSPDFPSAGSKVEREHLAYLRELIPQFADDDRIFAWDVHNEPDNYGAWRDDPQKVLRWLGRMADELDALAPNQLVTVGMGHTENLWLPGPDGRRVIDYSDVVSTHIYNAGTVARELADLRARTEKPIVVEEFGWPTGPACVENYTETTQLALYREVLAAARQQGASVFSWTLRDFDARPTVRFDGADEYYGLVRPDGSLKPAAAEFAAFAGTPPLPSAVVTNQPLTTTSPRFPDNDTAPLLIAESGHQVKGVFRLAWEQFGGRESLGLPLTEAFEQAHTRRVVQYFEGAALEYYPENAADPLKVSQAEQLVRVLRPVDLGRAAAAQRGLPPADGAIGEMFREFYERYNGEWRWGGPISPALTEDIGGVATTVQYFERGRLEVSPITGAVLVGALGQQAWDAQCAVQNQQYGVRG
jgi:hypothetical protein